MSEPIDRMKAYSKRRKEARGIHVEHIHGFDVSPDGGFELLLPDVDFAIDRIEHLERVLSEVRDLIGMAENGARREAIAAIDEALK